MATFGTDAIQDSIFATDDERRRAHQATIARRSKLRQHRATADGDCTATIVDAAALDIDQPLTLAVWLEGAGVAHVEAVLQRNGFDDVDFLVSV